MTISPDDPLLAAAVKAVQEGDVEPLQRLLKENPDLAISRLAPNREGGCRRTLLHVAADWPGHFPNGPATVAALIQAGADVNAHCNGPQTETPLHWAASSDDVEVLDALIDGGADIEVRGAVIGGGTPLWDAVAFGQWRAARRLVERGAATALWHAAALGMMNRIEEQFDDENAPTADEITHAFWFASHGGQQSAAEYLLDRGANLNWVPPWEERTPLDTAQRTGAATLVEWLRSQGAKSAEELKS